MSNVTGDIHNEEGSQNGVEDPSSYRFRQTGKAWAGKIRQLASGSDVGHHSV